MRRIASVVAAVTLAGSVVHMQDVARPPSVPGAGAGASPTLEDAQRLFYNGRYEDAAVLAQELCASGAEDLEACELRTASLHFQIRRAMGDSGDQEKAWKACGACPGLMSAFISETSRGQSIARARLQKNPDDEAALFLLGKIDLNYVWLQLGTLGRKTGWKEYWEARKSLDKVLKQTPDHVRARVARAWIDYIVDTKMPRGTRWLLGGGNKKRGLRVVREAAGSEAEYFARVEAAFALWDMQVRERDVPGAVATARDLARDFPENRELAKFLSTHATAPAQ